MQSWTGCSETTTCGWRKCWMILLLPLLTSTTSCGPKAAPPTKAVVVERGEVVALPDGTFRVTRGWMVHRMKVEQGLKAALERCEAEGRSRR